MAQLSCPRLIPGQLAQHHWYLVSMGAPSPPLRLRAGSQGRCQTQAIEGSSTSLPTSAPSAMGDGAE